MPTLAELQHSLQDFMLDNTAEAEQLTLETPQFSRQERLQIYHNAYRLRLIDALRNDFPALEKVLGEERFSEICSEFIAVSPSTNPSLRWLGEKFPEFLQARDALHIGELAAFEWAQTMAFDAANASLASIDDIRALPPEAWMNMQLEFHPSVHTLWLKSNAPALWNGYIKEEGVVDLEVAITTEPQAWLVWREDLQVVYRALEQSEASALLAFLSQKNFAEVCTELCNWFAEEQVPMQAARFLQQWLQAGLITGIHQQ